LDSDGSSGGMPPEALVADGHVRSLDRPPKISSIQF
jgi:hypothetical protein